ncbi:hypothetical protein Patl1_13221 [Pistacia atlantica]|uniref:Uncharacterized protein n=1 Tax=Pistacia atlantica TaxID=434234 RepID=A0ACC1AV67_9ROSI|nr:hypothetical protein Patl1_13221 [Pistacia atlantica]
MCYPVAPLISRRDLVLVQGRWFVLQRSTGAVPAAPTEAGWWWWFQWPNKAVHLFTDKAPGFFPMQGSTMLLSTCGAVEYQKTSLVVNS